MSMDHIFVPAVSKNFMEKFIPLLMLGSGDLQHFLVCGLTFFRPHSDHKKYSRKSPLVYTSSHIKSHF